MNEEETRQSVTQALLDWGRGNTEAIDRLAPLIYAELRRIARGHLRREIPNHSFQSADLANEAYLRLVEHDRVDWQSRAHFFAIASTMMRRILVDHARKRLAAKRGGATAKVAYDDELYTPAGKGVDVVALDHAMSLLESLDPRQSRVVELRYFGGLTVNETAQVLGLSPATVNREWRAARTWLFRELTRT